MIIKRLELQGFKSFSEKTKLIFHSGITAIIGPNGTGKSNIVDALLWVLGEKRMKGLRGERSADIIFNGNTKVPPMGMADVSLFLEDKDDELSISHRVFRSKESEYRLNGKQVRLKDIQQELYRKAIGETQYFVIEQGSVGLFLSSKPQEKRALLEEAAGTAYYKDKKRLAEIKLENTEQNLIRLEDIIEEVSKAKNSLKRQANAAIRYRELREKIRELTLLHYRSKINLAEKNQHDSLQVYQKNNDREREALYVLKDTEKALAEKRKELWDLESKTKKGQENLFLLRNKLSQTEIGAERQIKTTYLIDERIKQAQESIIELSQEHESLEKARKEAEKNIETLNLSLSQTKDSLQSFNQKGRDLQGEIEAKQKTVEKLRGEALVNLSELTEWKNERARYEKELELVSRQEEKLQIDLLTEQKELNQSDSALNGLEETIRREKKALEEKKKEFAENERKISQLTASLEDLQNRHIDLEKKKEKKSHHLHAIEQLLQKEKNAAVSSKIQGSIGLLADLIESDPEYIPAVDVFWREESKAQLVSVQTFQEELLRSHLRGNFLLLSGQKKTEASSIIVEDPQVLGYLKAKIRPDSKIKDNLSAISDAVIVKEVRTAVQLWIKHPSASFVTLQGDILHSSGLLRMGEKKEGILVLNQEVKTLADEIKRLEEQISPLSQEIGNIRAKKKNLDINQAETGKLLMQMERDVEAKEREKGFASSDREKTETTVILFKKEIDLLAKDKDSAAERLASLSDRVKEHEDRDGAFRRKIEEEEKALAQLQEKADLEKTSYYELRSQTNILDEKIQNLNDRIKTMTGRTAQIEHKTAVLKEDINDAGEQKKSAGESLRIIEQDAGRFENEIKEHEGRLAESEARLSELNVEQQELEKKLEFQKEEHETRKDLRIQSEIKKAEIERDLVNLEESCWQETKKTLQEVKEEMTGDIIPDENIEEELETSKDRLQRIDNVNLMAEEEYLIQEKRHDFLIQERDDLRQSIDSTKEAITKIDKESKSQFQTALSAVNVNFKEVFSLLFEGGNAEVKLSDPSNPLESGVEIIAQPPGKRVQTLSLLSGGEKTLTSLAFFFALFRYKPTPFCILDEVDAALDEANLSRFLNLMKKIKTQTQFIIITHNSKTMEVADYIYGTTMAEPSITSIFSVKMDKEKSEE